MCKLYFLTSDPNTYTCPWCQKAERGASITEAEYASGGVGVETQMLVLEEVQ